MLRRKEGLGVDLGREDVGELGERGRSLGGTVIAGVAGDGGGCVGDGDEGDLLRELAWPMREKKMKVESGRVE